jgi:ABC-2 type transport system ATP-binding protein
LLGIVAAALQRGPIEKENIMANEVRIKLTNEQKAKIKEATGKEMTELRVESVGGNPAFSPVAPKLSARATAARAASARATSARAESARKVAARSTSARLTSARAESARNTAARSTAARSTAARSTAARSTAARSTAARSVNYRADLNDE